jgi:hypothetical protein
MLTPDTYVCPNAAEVAAKIMDGEAILINLSDGMYYSMDLVGGLVWELIEGGGSLGEIATTVAAHYEADPDRAEADVRRLVQELVDARLVRIGAEPPDARGPTRREPPAQRLAYVPPRLHAYSDMAEMLALDPPHPLLTETLSRYPRQAPSS